MKNREFRELQVSSTQLAIIFFGILIIGVVIFLLGVSVGKKHAQASLKAGSALAQKAPEQVKDRLIIPEAKTETPKTVEAPKPAPVEKEAQPPLKAEEARAKMEPSSPAKENPKASPDKPLTAAPKPEAPAQKAKPGPKVETAAPPKKGLYYVQVGALADRTEAAAVSQKYKSQGYAALVLDPQPTDGKPVFRVRIGGFATKEEADSVRAKLASASTRRVDYFIVRD
jgi:cell division protein FtsN